MKLADGAALVLAGIEETLYYYTFPRNTGCLRANNPLERLLREVRRGRHPMGYATLPGYEPPSGSETGSMISEDYNQANI